MLTRVKKGEKKAPISLTTSIPGATTSHSLKQQETPLITIIVPVYNEEKTVGQLLTRLMFVVKNKLERKKKWQTEVIIVDDGSSDRSREIITSFIKNQKNWRLLVHSKNKGKGAALSTALKHARGKACIIQDADLEYDPREIPKIIEPIIRDKAHVVFGSRFLNLKYYNGLWANLLGNKIHSLAASVLLQRRITDLNTCYKAFRRDLIETITARSFDADVELAVKLLINKNVKYLELPIHYYPRIDGKKIRKIHGITILIRLIYLILRFDIINWKFISRSKM